MKNFNRIASTALSLSLLMPAVAFAAEETPPMEDKEVTEDEILDLIDTGGGMGYGMPYPSQGVTVSVHMTKEVTPDTVGIYAYCDTGEKATRAEVKTELQRMYDAIKSAVGTKGRVRKTGGSPVYPYYGPEGSATNGYSGTLNISIRILDIRAGADIATIVEDQNCTANWEAQLLNTEEHETTLIDTLMSKLDKRRAVFEKLLNRKLTNIVGVSLDTWADGMTYDPDTNKADASTTLTITYDLTPQATLRQQRRSGATMPMGY